MRELLSCARVVRRWYFMTFRRACVMARVQKRKGTCGRHGCCDLSALTGLRRCIDREDRTRCLKWGDLPLQCRIYPFDEADKIPETRSYCNFHWKEEE